jgi:hypothetical protein
MISNLAAGANDNSLGQNRQIASMVDSSRHQLVAQEA